MKEYIYLAFNGTLKDGKKFSDLEYYTEQIKKLLVNPVYHFVVRTESTPKEAQQKSKK